jgi:hypothetical protein
VISQQAGLEEYPLVVIFIVSALISCPALFVVLEFFSIMVMFVFIFISFPNPLMTTMHHGPPFSDGQLIQRQRDIEGGSLRKE